MTFQNPAVLWWLAPLLGTIIVLYLLKMRRRDVRVPATFLWPKLTADIRANAPIQKLRFSWLLVLQLLAVALLVTGFAGPMRRAHGLNGKATVIVLDASASMGATDVKPSRFELAKRKAADLVETMNSSDQCALIEAGSVTRVLSPLSADKARLRVALRDAAVTDAPNDMGEALRLASALAGSHTGGRIIVYSDGDFPAITDFSPGKSDVLFESVGIGGKNLAITALDAAATQNGGQQLFVGVKDTSPDPMHATLTFLADGQVIDARAIDVKAGQTLGQTVALPSGARKAEARIDAPGDVLAADNQASLYLQGAGTVRTLLITSGDLFLERALALQPSLRLDRAPAVPEPDGAGTPGPGDYDLVIFDGVPPVPVKAASVLSFGGVSSDFDAQDDGPLNQPHLATWNRDDPLLRHVDLSDVLIEKARKVTATPGGRIIASGPDGPLMIASEQGGRRRVYVAWNLLDSDFPLRVAFPIFMDNAVTWLTSAAQAQGGGLTVRAGQPFQVPAPDGAKTVILTAPNGTKTEMDVSSGVVTVRGDAQVGAYQLTAPGMKIPIAVNLLNEAESDVTPRQSLDLSGHAVAASGPSLILAEIWRPLALLTLALLALEWWVYVRKS